MAKKKTKSDDKVMALVERELKKKPGATVDELYEKARAVDKSVGQLSKRQFNARYPLQVKRRRSRTGKSRSRGKAKKRKTTTSASTSAGGRDAVRSTLMSFASDMASAEARKDLVQFLAGIDKYVDRVMKAASK